VGQELGHGIRKTAENNFFRTKSDDDDAAFFLFVAVDDKELPEFEHKYGRRCRVQSKNRSEP
jgi:hypothetical protein